MYYYNASLLQSALLFTTSVFVYDGGPKITGIIFLKWFIGFYVLLQR